MSETALSMATSRRARQAQQSELFRTDYGAFRPDGLAYLIRRPDTPRPWINIISNGTYGLVVSQNGGGFSWWENANLARLTCWTQDLIRDEAGKWLYVRDDDSGEVWSASWKPMCAAYDHYEVEHAIGSTTFTQRRQGIETRWTLVVPPKANLELWHVQVKSLGNTPRRLSLFSYAEWCLGNGTDWHREFQKTFIETTYDEPLRALIGIKRRLPMPAHISTGMSEWPLSGFHTVDRPVASYEGDKEKFLGRYRGYHHPEAIERGTLSKTLGKWNDSIAGLQVRLSLEPGQSDEVVFALGVHTSRKETESAIREWVSPAGVKKALDGTKYLWRHFLDGLNVQTPDEGFDLMTNTWLKYQAISGRVWARTAYYQSSAAYGYRDQLQDSHVFMPLAPELAKKQILLHAAHQYLDGVVLHWWLTLVEVGPRSGLSDPHLWLVYLTLNYILETDDLSILRDKAPYLDEPAKRSPAGRSPERARRSGRVEGTLFDHCTRSIELTLKRFSKRGLPLIGHGDWNDGLSAAGSQWKGESLWVGHFLYQILQRWSELLGRLKEEAPIKIEGVSGAALGKNMTRYRRRAETLKTAINRYGWDGKWYWYASRDNGQLIGSKSNREGRIHLNVQTWSVISGTATPERLKTAMASAKQLLYQEFGPLLLTPAYTKPDSTIGYLSRYAPGTRENGGVYSHGATWAVLAECMRGNGDLAYELYLKLCPPHRGMNADAYAGEPYVMPGNTDGPESPFFGRAGWTWYTGSAAWLFRISTEWILGVRPSREGLLVDPCIPSRWNGFRITRQFRGTTFDITAENPEHVSRGVKQIWLDGKPLQGPCLPDLRDGRTHSVRVVLGSHINR